MVGTPKNDQRFIPARTRSPFVGSRCSGVPSSGDTLRQPTRLGLSCLRCIFVCIFRWCDVIWEYRLVGNRPVLWLQRSLYAVL